MWRLNFFLTDRDTAQIIRHISVLHTIKQSNLSVIIIIIIIDTTTTTTTTTINNKLLLLINNKRSNGGFLQPVPNIYE